MDVLERDIESILSLLLRQLITARGKGSQMLNDMSQAIDTSFRYSIKIKKKKIKISTLPWTDSFQCVVV